MFISAFSYWLTQKWRFATSEGCCYSGVFDEATDTLFIQGPLNEQAFAHPFGVLFLFMAKTKEKIGQCEVHFELEEYQGGFFIKKYNHVAMLLAKN